MPPPRPAGTVALLTDYGLADPYAGVLRGAVLRAHPRATVVDLSHAVPPQDLRVAGLFLCSAIAHFPPGTVFVVVVDPGVGTRRRSLCVAQGEHLFVAPDNGVLSPVLPRSDVAGGGECRVLDLERLGIEPTSRTFHGRDVYGPVAGWLAGGRFGFQALGPRIEDPVRLAPAEPVLQVLHVDHFGNLITDVPAAALADVVAVRCGDEQVPLVATYADAPPGGLLALVNAYGLLEVAVRDGRATDRLGIGRGAPVRLVRRPH